jgi:hypothetical protein
MATPPTSAASRSWRSTSSMPAPTTTGPRCARRSPRPCSTAPTRRCTTTRAGCSSRHRALQRAGRAPGVRPRPGRVREPQGRRRGVRGARPDWPSRRLAPIDRAILRLAHFEMTSGRTPPKVAINEAVELAKAFSTEKSPAFINGLLGKVLKRLLRGGGREDPPTPQAVPVRARRRVHDDATHLDLSVEQRPAPRAHPDPGRGGLSVGLFKSVVGKLKKGLDRTRESFVGGLRSHAQRAHARRRPDRRARACAHPGGCRRAHDPGP